jgi:hypothetical protein
MSKTEYHICGSPRYFLQSLTLRIGNTEWARYLDSFAFAKRILRVVKLGDVVAHYPPRQLGYIHSTRQFIQTPQGETKECHYINQAGTGETDECNLPLAKTSVDNHRYYFGWKATPGFCCCMRASMDLVFGYLALKLSNPDLLYVPISLIVV